ncbi:MAG: HDOD domain-containing protein [Chromatiales bacterium]
MDHESAVPARQRGERPTAHSLVAEVDNLVSPPDVCIKLSELLQSPDTSVQQIGEVILRDPNLTARLMRLVNSPAFGLRARIDTVSRAITVLGTRELYSMVLAISAVRTFRKLPSALVNMDTYWRHSIFSALLARILARRCGVLHPERLFIATLLHDVGSLVLYRRLPEVAAELLLTAQGNEQVLCHAERDVLGFTHAELGGLLLEHWRMPEPLSVMVARHHEPAAAGDAKLEASIVHVADVLANHSGIGGFCEATANTEEIDPVAMALVGTLAASDKDAITGEAGSQLAETAAALAA